MGRPRRVSEGGLVYHVLNRANARRPIFEGDGDFLAFERILTEMQKRVEMRILAYCLMPNHWHLVLWPQRDGDLSAFIRLVTLTQIVFPSLRSIRIFCCCMDSGFAKHLSR